MGQGLSARETEGSSVGAPAWGLREEVLLQESSSSWSLRNSQAGGKGRGFCSKGQTLPGRAPRQGSTQEASPEQSAPGKSCLPHSPDARGVITGHPSSLPAGHPCPSLPRLPSSPEDVCFYSPTSWPRHLPGAKDTRAKGCLCHASLGPKQRRLAGRWAPSLCVGASKGQGGH